MATKKTKATKKVTKQAANTNDSATPDQMRAAAMDINEKLDLDPPLPTGDPEDIAEAIIKEGAGDGFYEGDSLEDETLGVLAALGVTVKEGDAPAEEDAAPEPEPDEDEAPAAKKPAKAKAEKPAKVKAEKPAKVKAEKGAAPEEKTKYNHRVSSEGGRIDAALLKGGTMEDIIASTGLSKSRIGAHIKHLVEVHEINLVTAKTGRITIGK